MKQNLFNKNVLELGDYILFALKEKTAKLAPELTARNRAPISMAMGAPTAHPPKLVIDRLKELLDEPGMHTYSTPKGEPVLREAISKYMKRRFNVEMDAENEVFSLIGSKEGLANLVRAITTPAAAGAAGVGSREQNEQGSTISSCEGDIILVPDPIYASYWEFIKCAGAIGHPIPLTKENNYMPDMEQVWATVADPTKVKAMVINYPNNPLGAVATREYVKSVVEFCKKKDILLISDAAYSEVYFDDAIKPFSVFEIEGAKDIAVEFFSFSKPYALTGWRLGWVCGNEYVIKHFGKAKSTVDNGHFKATQIACAELLNSKEGDEYIKRENMNFKRKQQFLVDGFRALGYPLNNVPAATFYLWLPIPPRYESSAKFCQELLEKSGIVTVPGSSYGKCGEGFFRVSYVCEESEMQTVLDRFKEDGFEFH